MTSILILDLALTGALLLLVGGSVVFYVSNYRWLKAYGTDVGAISTHVRRDNIAHQTCLVTATWTDPRTDAGGRLRANDSIWATRQAIW